MPWCWLGFVHCSVNSDNPLTVWMSSFCTMDQVNFRVWVLWLRRVGVALQLQRKRLTRSLATGTLVVMGGTESFTPSLPSVVLSHDFMPLFNTQDPAPWQPV